MSRITCTRRIAFDAAHRVMGHEGTCKDLHGHRYAIEATFEAVRNDGLDGLGRVIDFGEIRNVLGAWVNARWDHNTILYDKDAALGEAISGVTRQDIFYLPFNPTAENMARYVLETVCPQLFGERGVRCIRIRLDETPNCHAEAGAEDR